MTGSRVKHEYTGKGDARILIDTSFSTDWLFDIKEGETVQIVSAIPEKHVNPGPASLNTVVIDDSYRERKKDPMTEPQQQEILERILIQEIKKKEFKPYLNHPKKAVWFEDIDSIVKEQFRSRPAPSQPPRCNFEGMCYLCQTGGHCMVDDGISCEYDPRSPRTTAQHERGEQ